MAVQVRSSRVVKQSPVRATHYTFDERHQRVTVLSSRLTRDYLNLLSFDASVQDIVAEPFTLKLDVPGGVRRHTPSFLVVDENGEEVIHDVRSSRYVQSSDYQLKRDRLVHFFGTQGRRYQIVTEKEVYVGHRASNLAYLRPALKSSSPVQEFELIATLLPYRVSKLPRLMEDLAARGIDTTIVRRAIAHGLIRCDLTVKWDQLELVW